MLASNTLKPTLFLLSGLEQHLSGTSSPITSNTKCLHTLIGYLEKKSLDAICLTLSFIKFCSAKMTLSNSGFSSQFGGYFQIGHAVVAVALQPKAIKLIVCLSLARYSISLHSTLIIQPASFEFCLRN